MSEHPPYDETTSDRRREPRLGCFFFFNSKLALLKPGFLWEGRYCLWNQLNFFFWRHGLRSRVTYSWAYTAIRPSYISQLKMVGRAATFESWPSDKGVNSKWETRKRACPWSIGSRFSQRYIARSASCTYYFGVRLERHKCSVVTKPIQTYATVHCRQYRKTWLYWLREGRVNNYLSFFRHYHLNESF